MVSVHSSIEIAATPDQVKAVFFDWSKYPQWAQGQLQSIQHATPKDKVELGDKLKIKVQGMTFSGTVSGASETKFQWRGGLSHVMIGEHTFRFEPSQVTPGATTFINSEQFTGALVWPFKYTNMGHNADGSSKFDIFNRELKNRVESLL